MENEPVKFKAFNFDYSNIVGSYVDLSQLTPEQIKEQENLGTIPDGEQYFKDGDIKGNLLDFWNINTLKEK